MDTTAPVFEKIYQDYLDKINKLDLQSVAQKIGAKWTEEGVIVPLFGKPYRICKKGILDPSGEEPGHSIKVVLCQYLLLHPASHREDSTWVSYKDFKNAGPFANAFHNNAEMTLAKNFTGRLGTLKEACLALGGYNHFINSAYDLHLKFDALPTVPILLLCNDADDEFPAQCILLFERRAKNYLDMECLAILGWLLADYLNELSKNITLEEHEK
jgi:hypothetical protein